MGAVTTLNWNGMNWNTSQNSPPGNTAPPPTSPPPSTPENLWLPSNVSVVDGNLQLSLQQNSGWIWSSQNGWQLATPGQSGQVWAACEAVLELPSGTELAYGTFCVTVIAGTPQAINWQAFTGPCTAATAEINTVFGAFTYDPDGTSPFGEIDLVEIGYQAQNAAGGWINTQPGGPSSNSDAQHCIQPWDGPSDNNLPDWNNVHRMALDPASIPASGEVTFAAVWRQDAPVEFYAAYGAFTPASFPFQSAPFCWISGVNGPSPTATMSFYLNLWPYSGGPSTGQPQTFTVTNVFVPTQSS